MRRWIRWSKQVQPNFRVTRKLRMPIPLPILRAEINDINEKVDAMQRRRQRLFKRRPRLFF